MKSREPWRESLRSLPALVTLVSVPYARRRPARLLLVLLAISLGVAAIVASGNLIHSALRSIESGWQVAIEGVDLRVANGFAGVPDELISSIREIEGVAAVSGLLSESLTLRLRSEVRDVQLVSIDLLGDDSLHRKALGADAADIPDETLLLTRLDAVLVERNFAAAHGLEIGSKFDAELRSGQQKLYVAGLIEPSEMTAAFGGAIAVMDLPVAQLLLDREGMLDSIDVRVSHESTIDDVAVLVEERIEGRATLTRADRASPELASLISNLRLILGVPGMIALVIGSLLIHHAVSVAVSHRTPQIDVIRSLGASRRSLLLLFAFEAVLVGGMGSALGVALGWIGTPLAAGIVRQTLSALYRPLATTHFDPAWASIGTACVLGVGITLYAFLAPARSNIRSITGLSVASPARERWQRARGRAWVGALVMALGLLAGSLQLSGIEGEALATVATASDAMILLGAGLLLPVLLFLVARPGRTKALGGRWPTLRLAWLNLSSDPARSALVLTSVMIGAAYVMITVGPIGSLRHTIVSWLERTQSADLVVAASGSIGFFPNSAALPRALEGALRELPGVVSVEPTGLVTQPFADRWMVLVARRPSALGGRYPMTAVAGSLERGRDAMQRGDGGIVSRHFANQHHATVGDVLPLRSPTGNVDYRIEAIVQDYSSADLGTVFVSPALLEARWRQASANTLHLWIDDALRADKAAVSQAVRMYCGCAVLTALEFETRIAGVVDTTFYMAYALEVVAVVVVVLSVLSFFAIALDERRGQLATLRATGASQSQLARSLLWEAALIGSIGGIVGCAIGIPLGRRMAMTTMRAGGGFELDFIMPTEVVALTVIGAIVVCIIAIVVQLIAGGLRKASAESVVNQ